MPNIKQFISTLKEGWKLLQSPDVPRWIKVVIPVFFLIYWVSPIDIFPDIIPILGIIDELALLYGIMHILQKRYGLRKSYKKPPILDADIVE